MYGQTDKIGQPISRSVCIAIVNEQYRFVRVHSRICQTEAKKLEMHPAQIQVC